MTIRDIFCQVLTSRISSTHHEAEAIFNAFLQDVPEAMDVYDTEIPDEMAAKMLRDLRKDEAGIISWLLQYVPGNC